MDLTRRHLLTAIPLTAAIARAGAQAGSGDMTGFQKFDHQGREVYWIGDGPAILFLHELPGLIPEAVQFARRINKDCKFSVYLPVLFGSPGVSIGRLRSLLTTPCWGSQFDCHSNTHLGEIVPRMKSLVAEVNARAGGKGIALMGNCLTGSVPLAVMADPSARKHLLCCVCAQPALPFGVLASAQARRSFGLTESELQSAANSGIPL